MKFFIKTFGCALNRSDSELMREILISRGFEEIDNLENADVIIVNTCTVRKDSDQKAIEYIEKVKQLNKNSKIVVAGCIPGSQPYLIKSRFPDAVLISPYETNRIVDAIFYETDFLGYEEFKRYNVPIVKTGNIAIVPLNDGCLSNCNFCITKVARRRLLSRMPKVILKAIKDLVENGVYEIQLSSQDASVYGIDFKGRPLLPDLVETINQEIKGEYMLRIAMMNPDGVKKDLENFVKIFEYEHVFKFLHLPIQSGDDEVLKIMGRDYSIEDALYVVNEFRSRIKDLRIATDIIVGHPGESEEAFENTLKVVVSGLFDRVHIAQYTPRPFTLSARMPQISDSVKKKRSSLLKEELEKVLNKKMEKYVGKIIEGVVVEKDEKRESYIARTKNYISIVLKGGKKVSLGMKVNIEITDYTPYDLRGIAL
ncbi:tRNA (N(6)-L-threonylcarbamoyladenosine(37)-C(2))-methylthiotransferase [Fervidicoccus fontis]|jgi:MiaB/RimO family radical SAM methylthiotransferase|uniref:tRNA-t(6)A37 methylthiotransferase n=2 Tax=Fervidicoccus fontis TaxID=683846 RepID=I0A2D8_FERFK|nr:tRNA (N(6)-L-threonylcarbamoyladenosine(37)-C(2))-methylthiotransferase [Fervidicoccus fontis]AFH43145.1 RNA modification enzyme, MiaB family [Fervidicoccus fontis Kam940]MBE9390524.1 tRNA (N(6)-L-threonylcarbamoyladenosine(37)-C(2))-methylthiotransferase [Fervidicoccus fontis]PMB75848.1 MAG: tRNA (N6-isopentenyl adenosine(37)-C2)-methylthiotransferase MiaB [Fervidicoccus fontis]PMB77727.1 MAG: tRNA (N6-isopentenyl adenosine(37)-C2)-methylthiotransferase MiaB [Fervidicoccus fontis]HEW64269.